LESGGLISLAAVVPKSALVGGGGAVRGGSTVAVEEAGGSAALAAVDAMSSPVGLPAGRVSQTAAAAAATSASAVPARIAGRLSRGGEGRSGLPVIPGE